MSCSMSTFERHFAENRVLFFFALSNAWSMNPGIYYIFRLVITFSFANIWLFSKLVCF